jgi:hypothetical protein
VTMALLIERMFAAGFLVAALSHLLWPRLWGELFYDLLQSRYAPLVVAVYTLPLGLLIVVGHNLWAWDVAVVTTVAGWIMTLKSVVYLLYPGALRKIAPQDYRGRKFAAVGAVMTPLGIWMVYGAFLRG